MTPTFFASQLKVFVSMLQDAASKVFPLLLTYPLGLGLPLFWDGLYGDDSLLSNRSSFKNGKMNW
jgi:hypothetical protein